MRIGNAAGGSPAITRRRRWLAIALSLLAAAAVFALMSAARASTTGNETLKPGWDIFPPGGGTVSWVPTGDGGLEVTYTISGGPANANLDVGLLQTDISDGVMLTGVVGGSFDWTGLGIGPFSREGQSVGPYNAWIFGEEFTTDGSGNGSMTVELTGNAGTWDVQFFVLPDGTTTPNYESKGVFGSTTAVTVVDDDGTVIVCEDGGEEYVNGDGDDSCESFNDPDGAWSATCDGCEGAVIIRDEGDDVADIEVTGKSAFVLILTTADKGPNPGQAFVLIDNDGDESFESELPNCGTNGRNDTNCVHINRVRIDGELHTQYIVFYRFDPRFKFG